MAHDTKSRRPALSQGERVGKEAVMVVTRRYVRRKFTEKLPADVQLVARPSRWGNPYRVERVVTHDGRSVEWAVEYERQAIYRAGDDRRLAVQMAVDLYADWLRRRLNHDVEAVVEFLRPLFGKRMACYCKEGTPCHVDVLIEFVRWAEDWDVRGRAVHTAQLAIAKYGKAPIVIDRDGKAHSQAALGHGTQTEGKAGGLETRPTEERQGARVIGGCDG